MINAGATTVTGYFHPPELASQGTTLTIAVGSDPGVEPGFPSAANGREGFTTSSIPLVGVFGLRVLYLKIGRYYWVTPMGLLLPITVGRKY